MGFIPFIEPVERERQIRISTEGWWTDGMQWVRSTGYAGGFPPTLCVCVCRGPR